MTGSLFAFTSCRLSNQWVISNCLSNGSKQRVPKQGGQFLVLGDYCHSGDLQL